MLEFVNVDTLIVEADVIVDPDKVL